MQLNLIVLLSNNERHGLQSCFKGDGLCLFSVVQRGVCKLKASSILFLLSEPTFAYLQAFLAADCNQEVTCYMVSRLNPTVTLVRKTVKRPDKRTSDKIIYVQCRNQRIVTWAISLVSLSLSRNTFHYVVIVLTKKSDDRLTYIYTRTCKERHTYTDIYLWMHALVWKWAYIKKAIHLIKGLY